MGGAIRPSPCYVFALYSKNLKATDTWKFLTFYNFWLRMPLRIFYFLKKIMLHLLTAFFRHKDNLDFFPFIKKYSYKPHLQLFLDMINCLGFWDPLRSIVFFHICRAGYQNRVKSVPGIQFRRNFKKVIFTWNVMPFSGTLKTIQIFNKFKW